MSQISYPVTFNDINLETITGLTILRTDAYIPAKRNVSLSDIVRTNKSKVNSAFYNERIINIGVGIARNTRDLAEQSLDSLMSLVQPIDKALVVPQSGGSRKYFATYDSSDLVQGGGSYIELDLFFKCSDRFGYDIASTLLLSISGYTSYYRSDQLNFGGSALWQTPVITLTYTAVTGGTNATVYIGNSDTGQELSITRTFIAGDVISINPLDDSNPVKVNGNPVDFSGAVPTWQRGLGYWYYHDTFSARTFNGSITHVRRYV